MSLDQRDDETPLPSAEHDPDALPPGVDHRTFLLRSAVRSGIASGAVAILVVSARRQDTARAARR